MMPLFNCVLQDDIFAIPVLWIRFLGFINAIVKINKKPVTFFFLIRLGVKAMLNDS